MVEVKNNATVVRFEQLPDCLFRIWIKPDWDINTINWIPGQFLRLGILEQAEDRKKLRAMTIVDIQDGIVEFYMVSVSHGITSPKIASLQPHQRCYLEAKITGIFTLQNVPKTQNVDLWMIGTGTGIAPYLAMLKWSKDQLQQYRSIIFVHSVRSSSHLCYQKELRQYAKDHSLFHYVPVVTRSTEDTEETYLRERIPELVKKNTLSKYTNTQISTEDSIVMLCGHPKMIKDSLGVLHELGLTKHRRRKPGHILTERYF